MTEILCVRIYLQSERTSSMRTQRDSVSVVDIEWYSSEIPLLLFSNGTMRMMEINLKRSCSPITEQDLTGKKTSLLSSDDRTFFFACF